MVRFRALGRLLLAGSLVTAAACGGPEKRETETARKSKAKEAKERALLGEAREGAESGDIEVADQAYRKAFGIAQEIDILEEHVRFLINSGQATRAQETAAQYYNDNSTDSKGYELYAETLIAGGHGEEALAVAESLVKFDAKSPAGYEKRGRALVLLGRNEEGIADLQKAVELDGETPTYHTALGLALHAMKRYGEAGLSLTAALKRAPNDSMAHAYVGMARRDQEFLDDAKQELDRAIEIDSKNGRAWFELGLLYNRQSKQAEAENALAKAVQFSPYESRFWYGYGEIYRVQQRDDQAVAAYKKAVELDPPHPKALGKLVALLIDRGELDEADDLIDTQMERFPDSAQPYLARGALLAAQKKKKAAIDAYQKFLTLAPANDPERQRATDEIAALKKSR